MDMAGERCRTVLLFYALSCKCAHKHPFQFSTVVWLTSLGEDGGGGGGVSDLGSSLFLVSSYQATTQICVIVMVRSITKHIGQETRGVVVAVRRQEAICVVHDPLADSVHLASNNIVRKGDEKSRLGVEQQ